MQLLRSYARTGLLIFYDFPQGESRLVLFPVSRFTRTPRNELASKARRESSSSSDDASSTCNSRDADADADATAVAPDTVAKASSGVVWSLWEGPPLQRLNVFDGAKVCTCSVYLFIYLLC